MVYMIFCTNYPFSQLCHFITLTSDKASFDLPGKLILAPFFAPFLSSLFLMSNSCIDCDLLFPTRLNSLLRPWCFGELSLSADDFFLSPSFSSAAGLSFAGLGRVLLGESILWRYKHTNYTINYTNIVEPFYCGHPWDN